MAKARVISSLVTGSIGPASGLAANPEFTRLAMIANQLKDGQQAQGREANSAPFVGGVAITGIVVPGAGTIVVSHPLRRTPDGYIITRSKGGGGVFEFASNANTITFANPGGGPVTIDVWVY